MKTNRSSEHPGVCWLSLLAFVAAIWLGPADGALAQTADDESLPAAESVAPKPDPEPEAQAEPPEQQSQEAPFQRVITAMRAAEKQLAQGQTGDPTQAEQDRVISELAGLIDRLQKQPPPPSPAQNPPPPDKDNPEQKPQQQDPKPADGSDPMTTPDGSGAGEQKGPARESSDRNEAAPNTAGEKARAEALVQAIWGHLPPSLQKELLNVYSQKYLPKYDEQIRRYYEALAERDRKQKP